MPALLVNNDGEDRTGFFHIYRGLERQLVRHEVVMLRSSEVKKEVSSYAILFQLFPCFVLRLLRTEGERPDMERPTHQNIRLYGCTSPQIILNNSYKKSLAQEEGYGACFSREGSAEVISENRS